MVNNIYTEWLLEKIENENWGNSQFMIWNDQIVNYFLLKEKILYWQKFINDNSLSAGEIIAISGEFSLDAISLFLALISNKNIIVPFLNISLQQKSIFMEIADVQKEIYFDRDGNFLLNKFSREKKNRLLKDFPKQQSGLILFSSGSTGEPKGILHNLDILLEKYYKVKKSFRTLIFLLLDHIGGINTLFSILSSGGTIIIPNTRTPEEVCKSIEKYKVELLPTTPTFLNLLILSGIYKNYNLSSLKLITYGTEPMSEFLLTRLKKEFPWVEFKQTYGTTEIGIMSSKSKSSESTWVKIGGEGYETKVIEGILWIRAKTSMVGYLNSSSPFTKDGWFITGDIVETDGEYIKFLGRESDIINVGGQKVYPYEIENILLQMDNILDISVYGEKNPITGQIVCADIVLKETEDIFSLKKRIYQFCKDKLEKFKIPIKISIVDKDRLYTRRFKKIRRHKL